jgi:hypothetical protein
LRTVAGHWRFISLKTRPGICADSRRPTVAPRGRARPHYEELWRGTGCRPAPSCAC